MKQLVKPIATKMESAYEALNLDTLTTTTRRTISRCTCDGSNGCLGNLRRWFGEQDDNDDILF